MRIDKDVFDKLKTEESFWGLVALSRVVNALRFVHSPLEHYHGDDSPGAVRVRYNSFFFNCAILYEASLFINNLGKHHGQLLEFRALASLINSPSAQDLFNSNLGPLRNRSAFHFGMDEVGEKLKDIDLDEPIFLTAMGLQNGQVYYELADMCAFSTLSGSPVTGTEECIAKAQQLIARASELTLQFLDLAEEFLGTALKQEGWQLARVPGIAAP